MDGNVGEARRPTALPHGRTSLLGKRTASVTTKAIKPPRPTIPPLFHALVISILCVRACLGMAWVPRGVMLGLVAGSAMLAVLWCLLRASKQVDWLGGMSLCLMVAALSLGLAAVSLSSEHEFVQCMKTHSLATWSLRIDSDPVKTTWGMRCRAQARGEGMRSGAVWLTGEYELEQGDVIGVIGSFEPLGADEWSRSSRMQGVWGTVRLARVTHVSQSGGLDALARTVRMAARDALRPELSDGRALLAGCVVGDRRALCDRGLDKLFAACGVSHMVAVSGAHLATITSALGLALQRGRMRPWLRVVFLALCSGAFVLVCGAPPSAVRAWLMAGLASGSSLVGRRTDALSALSLAGLAMVLVEPSVTGQLGFLLSLACVGGLALFGRYASYLMDVLLPRVWMPRGTKAELRIRANGMRRDVANGLGASLVAQLVSAPLTLPVFTQLSLVAPLANLAVAAPLALAMTLGLVASCCAALPPLAGMVLGVSDVVTTLLLGALRLLASLPLATIPVEVQAGSAWALLIVASLGLIIVWPTLTRGLAVRSAGLLVVLVACLLVRWRFLAPARMCVLDVGQGDAILIQDGGSAVLIDTGPDDAVVRALARNHVLHLDAIVLTHLHDDHYGGVDDLLASIGCDRILMARGVAANLSPSLAEYVEAFSVTLDELAYHDVVWVGGFSLRVISPVGDVDGLENEDSLELLLEYEREDRRLSALLTGDAEQDMTGKALERGDVGDIDVLKVGHHGSEVSVSDDEAQKLLPELSVASAGEGNKYGHPRRECVNTLEGVGSLFLCTIECGDVELRPGRAGVVVSTQRGPS